MSQTDYQNAFISFQELPLSEDLGINTPISNPIFGILNLQMKTFTPIEKHHHLVFTVDCSGSMSERCSDGRTKMEHIKHTLTNMVYYFSDHPGFSVTISIFAFDGVMYTILEKEKVEKSNMETIVQQIQTIRPRNSTNIELAVESSKTFIDGCIGENPDHVVTHIFMTDGEATEGSTNVDVIKTKIHTVVPNVFIGFGMSHNASMLSSFGSQGRNSYYFIDILEKSGLVYGEILHDILYKVLQNCVVELQNGYIYDWKKNEWTSRLSIGDLVSEANKFYHLICERSYEVQCSVTSENVFTLETTCISIGNRMYIDGGFDFTKYVFRQKTQQLLYEGNQWNTKKKFWQRDYMSNDLESESLDTMREKLSNFMKKMLDYMETLEECEQPFIKLLCDDIHICLVTLGTANGEMYSTARQTSQGTQRIYTVTNVGGGHVGRLQRQRLERQRLERQTGFDIKYNDEVTPILRYKTLDETESPYLTQPAFELMRSVSDGQAVNYPLDDFVLSLPPVPLVPVSLAPVSLAPVHLAPVPLAELKRL
jgi:hypothetical protein